MPALLHSESPAFGILDHQCAGITKAHKVFAIALQIICSLWVADIEGCCQEALLPQSGVM